MKDNVFVLFARETKAQINGRVFYDLQFACAWLFISLKSQVRNASRIA